MNPRIRVAGGEACTCMLFRLPGIHPYYFDRPCLRQIAQVTQRSLASPGAVTVECYQFLDPESKFECFG